MYRNILLSCARQNTFDTIDNVMRHEGLAIVLANVTVGDDAGFGAQVARELSAVVIFYDDELLTPVCYAVWLTRRCMLLSDSTANVWRAIISSSSVGTT